MRGNFFVFVTALASDVTAIILSACALVYIVQKLLRMNTVINHSGKTHLSHRRIMALNKNPCGARVLRLKFSFCEKYPSLGSRI
jgi:hypothetical protein